ncbi:MAG: PhzF family phenazine biosynthesis protein [Prochlorococcaceae cyanobacterium]
MAEQPSLPALLVEAFSELPLQGNGAGVVRLSQPADRAWMQAVASRLKQSETAFLLPWHGEWALRWFTPSCEVPLCGHGTLAALVALGHWGDLEPAQPLRLHSRSGPLLVERQAGVHGGTLELPAGQLEPAQPSAALEQLLQSQLQLRAERAWNSSLGYWVVLLPASADLAGMNSIAAGLQGLERQGLYQDQSLPLQSLEPGG